MMQSLGDRQEESREKLEKAHKMISSRSKPTSPKFLSIEN